MRESPPLALPVQRPTDGIPNPVTNLGSASPVAGIVRPAENGARRLIYREFTHLQDVDQMRLGPHSDGDKLLVS